MMILSSDQFAAPSDSTFTNPILPGFHADPSICRAGDDYYLFTSTFEYFPDVPVYHSSDLVNWHQIGYVLTRKSQLNFSKKPFTEKDFPPTETYCAGDLAFRQHAGGHTDGPNWPTFLNFAERYFKAVATTQ